ncbi:hypothetical protein NAEGRDRAFT_80515 [Naegleria gruberi]|uniref:AB hydrolase-1 domain-containing protein n=1 Tax=Naegleria gruberi TaxID=5762 RepID=D2VM81_NAEGR|nr:uncharacterized protein NAEGRDRAFT_80515 [Naegleria gruberi]EFC41943.1 hypothetical protein NAEGRDRAFT_80515 [Naegleria gruberi]|eukprot:XP_002674687.1 hypothetical protein NAEGRDRAFT_80515 [Naegleria gruberi strain NEG-M]
MSGGESQLLPAAVATPSLLSNNSLSSSSSSNRQLNGGDLSSVMMAALQSSSDHSLDQLFTDNTNNTFPTSSSSITPNNSDNATSILLFLSNAGSVIAKSEIASVSERVKGWIKKISQSSNQIRFHLQFNISLTLGQILKYGIPITAVLLYCIYKLIKYVKYKYLRDKSKDISNPNNKYRISLRKLWKKNTKASSQDIMDQSDEENSMYSKNVIVDDSKSVQTNSEYAFPISSSYSFNEKTINGVKGVMLNSGRWLSYEEYGNTSTKTRVVFFFHSIGQSRLETPTNEHDSIGKRYGIRFIHVDRPGYGQSSQQKSRSFLSFARDIAQMSNILDIEQYSVIGVSSGSCYAWACAYLNIDNKVVSCSILSGELPYLYIPPSQTSRFLKDTSLLVNYLPKFIFKGLLNTALKSTVFSEPERFSGYVRQSSYFSKENIEDLQNFCSNCVLSMREGMNAFGVTEVIRELKMEREDWNFSLKDVSIPVHMWHGEHSLILPLPLLKSAIPSLISDRYNEFRVTENKINSQKQSKKSSNSNTSQGLHRIGSTETIETMTTSVTVETKTKTEESSNNNYRYTNVNLHTVADHGHLFWRSATMFEEVVKSISEHLETIYDNNSYFSETTSIFEFRTDF